MIYDCIIIGGGVSGLMAALELEKNNISYLLIEKNTSLGKKLLITGNNRCNVTNNKSIIDFVDDLTIENKRFLYSSLNGFGPEDIIAFLNDNDVDLVLENDLKYFPKSNKSITILNTLKKHIDLSKVKVDMTVKDITNKNGLFSIKTDQQVFQSRNVIVATGSKSFPTTGSTGDGIQFAKKFDIKYNEFSPAETSVYSNEIVKKHGDLQGIALKNVEVNVLNTKHKYTGDLLFTHYGLSGPAIYHLSEFIYFAIKDGNNKLSFNLSSLNSESFVTFLTQKREGTDFLRKALEEVMQKRVVKKVLEITKINNVKVSSLSTKQMDSIIKIVNEFTIKIDHTELLKKAYVNKGGILTNELNPKSFESKKVKGLYFIGETTDIHGPIGGYNITIAFASGVAAARSIAMKQ